MPTVTVDPADVANVNAAALGCVQNAAAVLGALHVDAQGGILQVLRTFTDLTPKALLRPPQLPIAAMVAGERPLLSRELVMSLVMKNVLFRQDFPTLCPQEPFTQGLLGPASMVMWHAMRLVVLQLEAA